MLKLQGKRRLAREASDNKIEKKEYRVVDKLEEGDYIFIHWNGFVFNANNYPYNLRDGVARRDIMVGEYIDYLEGGDTGDVVSMPAPATLKQFLPKRIREDYGQREENSSFV